MDGTRVYPGFESLIRDDDDDDGQVGEHRSWALGESS